MNFLLSSPGSATTFGKDNRAEAAMGIQALWWGQFRAHRPIWDVKYHDGEPSFFIINGQKMSIIKIIQYHPVGIPHSSSSNSVTKKSEASTLSTGHRTIHRLTHSSSAISSAYLARRTKSNRPKGPLDKCWGPEGSQESIFMIMNKISNWKCH